MVKSMNPEKWTRHGWLAFSQLFIVQHQLKYTNNAKKQQKMQHTNGGQSNRYYLRSNFQIHKQSSVSNNIFKSRSQTTLDYPIFLLFFYKFFFNLPPPTYHGGYPIGGGTLGNRGGLIGLIPRIGRPTTGILGPP